MKSLTGESHRVSPDRDRWRGVFWGLRALQVRLRFLLVVGGAFLIVGKWNTLRNYWETLTVSLIARPLSGAVSSDTEYFCPMCPGVLSEWPNRCSVCNMPLVRRRKGEAVQLPDGVLARMQLSPNRVQLAGIQTAAVAYRPLFRELVVRGIVESQEPSAGSPATVAAEIDQRDMAYVSSGTPAIVFRDIDLPGVPQEGRVSQIHRNVSLGTHRIKIEIEVSDAGHALWPGMQVVARIRRPIAELEPFGSQPADPPPLASGEVRKLYICPDHPQVLRERPGDCPEDDNPLVVRPLTELERTAWWCPMHPKVAADEPGHECQECQGMKLLPRIVRYRPSGQVLTVPETAVIDTGQRQVVYLERMPGMFDAVEIAIGPRCDGHYAVIAGLAPGERVAAAGAFLVDAETRLNPSVAASYFGAARGKSDAGQPSIQEEKQTTDQQAKAILEALEKLSPEERRSVERQSNCPVTGMPLGSMGKPLKLELQGHTVWLCCEGCTVEASEDPRKTIEKLKPPGGKPGR